jgi:hypothetical protein
MLVFVVDTEMIVGFVVFRAARTVELGGRVRRVRSPAG